MKGNAETETALTTLTGKTIYLRVAVKTGAVCQFSYSVDGKKYELIKETFQAEVGKWIGAKAGIYCTRTTQINDSGYADFDWFTVEPLK